MTEQKGKGNLWIRSTEAFQYKNTRSEFEYCHYWEKGKTISQTTAKYTKNPRDILRERVISNIDGFTIGQLLINRMLKV